MKSYQQFKRIGVSLTMISAAWLGLSAIFFPGSTSAQNPAPAVGFQAPEFSLSNLENEEIAFTAEFGKPVILNFWASWCPPCQAEMPALQKVYEEYQAAGLTVYAVDAANQDNLQDVQSFLSSRSITLPVLLDQDGSTARLYAVRALPTTFFISPDGVIQQVMIGGPFSEAFLRAEITELLTLEK